MKIASLVVRTHPEHIGALAASLREIPGVEVHGANADLGRLIVTVEDGDGYAMTDSLLAVGVARHVLGVTLAYEYTDEGLQIDREPPEPLPGCRTAIGAQDKEAVK
jgi:periplasmic nitrate reductase NapD